MDQLLVGFSAGLDAVEKEVLGATVNHGKRIAVLALAMGKHIGLNNNELIGLGACAILHDNALSEYLRTGSLAETQTLDMRLHCINGEENISFLPFPCNVKDIIKYHHEFCDKSGPFGMDPENTPIGAQLIAMADDLDIHYNLPAASTDSLDELRTIIENRKGTRYTPFSVDAMLAVLDQDRLDSLKDENIDATFQEIMPPWVVKKPATELMRLSEIVARIIDYKSHFTAKHSTQIANRAYWMARYYQFDAETCARIYIAAAFHDIGKMMTPTAILEKQGKLTPDEFATIKEHVYWSYIMLKDVEGLEEICRWAVTHHRKLDGTGYPDLPDAYLENDFVSRLMTCIDIYQAVRETRPYHAGRSHEETMHIMNEMVLRGEIDRQITADLDIEMARFKTGDGDVPSPFS